MDHCQYKDCGQLRQNPGEQIIEAWNVVLCPSHTRTFRYTEEKDRGLWIRKNTVPVTLGTCPNCDRNALLGDDYICAECRSDLSTKWSITFQRTVKSGLKEEELKSLLKILVEHEVAFEVKIESA